MVKDAALRLPLCATLANAKLKRLDLRPATRRLRLRRPKAIQHFTSFNAAGRARADRICDDFEVLFVQPHAFLRGGARERVVWVEGAGGGGG